MLLMSYRRETKKKIIFFGDSITEQGVLIGGYIEQINRLIEQEDLVKKYHTIAKGISGNKVYDLYLRIDEDVVVQSPNITVVFIGINDIWCKSSNGTGLDIIKFEKFYRAIIVKLLAINSKIILCTPTVIGEKKFGENLHDDDLLSYSVLILNLAKEYQIEICDLNQAFREFINQNNEENMHEGLLTIDGVHLNKLGNNIVAEKLWSVIKTIK
jgi:lysophospholipase L1-like esterase